MRKWGSPTTWFRQYIARMKRLDKTAKVPCGDCNECCKQGGILTLDDGQVYEADKNGCCSFLEDEKCTRYSIRPEQCRIYDCRIYSLLQLDFIEPREHMAEVYRSWTPKFNTRDDTILWTALRVIRDGTMKLNPDAIGIDEVATEILKNYLNNTKSYLDAARNLLSNSEN